jgi:hypothetical protein
MWVENSNRFHQKKVATMHILSRYILFILITTSTGFAIKKPFIPDAKMSEMTVLLYQPKSLGKEASSTYADIDLRAEAQPLLTDQEQPRGCMARIKSCFKRYVAQPTKCVRAGLTRKRIIKTAAGFITILTASLGGWVGYKLSDFALVSSQSHPEYDITIPTATITIPFFILLSQMVTYLTFTGDCCQIIRNDDKEWQGVRCCKVCSNTSLWSSDKDENEKIQAAQSYAFRNCAYNACNWWTQYFLSNPVYSDLPTAFTSTINYTFGSASLLLCIFAPAINKVHNDLVEKGMDEEEITHGSIARWLCHHPCKYACYALTRPGAIVVGEPYEKIEAQLTQLSNLCCNPDEASDEDQSGLSLVPMS